MTIALEALPVTEVVVEIPGGHRQVTPQRGGRYYLRAGSDDRYRSISGLPWPSDFAGATRYMAGSYVAEHIAEIAATPIDEIRAKVAKGAEDELTKAADRGTAVHHYVECRVKRSEPDWAYLERSGACEYLPAVDAYLRDHPAGEGLDEVTVFGESCGHRIAGTVDRVDLSGPVVVRDYKTRGARHDRREKEAAQLGAYAHCLLHGVYVDARGHDRTLEHIDWCEVVTFAPDGSYGIHRVELDVAIAAHEARMAFVGLGVGALYGRAERGSAAAVSECFQAELDAMADEGKMHLASLWREHAMPRIAELEPHHYVTARRLFVQARPWFDGPEPALPALATTEQVVDIRRRLEALPSDLSTTVIDGAHALRHLLSPVLSVDDLEDWERALVPAEAAHARRLEEIGANLPKRRSIAATLGKSFEQWTALDLDHAYALAEAAEAGVLRNVVDHPNVEPRWATWPLKAMSLAETHGKRRLVALAKAEAVALGLSAPKSYADVVADVVLFAATWAAAKRAPNTNTNTESEST